MDKLKGKTVEGVSEDDVKSTEKQVQAVHDEFIKTTDELGEAKKKVVQSLE
jgi:ribosome recycling factor